MIRKVNENHAFYDVTRGNCRGYTWELWRYEDRGPDAETRFVAVEKIGRKLDGETFCDAARRMGVEPTYREEKIAEQIAEEEKAIRIQQAQVRRVTQAEIDFVGGLENYRRDIEPHRQIVIVTSRRECGVDYFTPEVREAMAQ